MNNNNGGGEKGEEGRGKKEKMKTREIFWPPS